jgi:homoserine kinase
VPAPVPNDKGAIVNLLNDKPAAIVSKLEGQSQLDPQPVHCAALGDMLARMHLAAKDFKILQPNLRGLAWWLETTPAVLPFLPAELGQLLASEVQYQKDFAATADYRALPRGPVHADLFRNNAMFVGEQLSGIFDFYFAGCDTWLFDLAVTVNDWCVDLETGVLDTARSRSHAGRLPRRASVLGGRRHRLAAHAACRCAALLALAPVRFLPAARSRNAHAARPHALRTHPAPAHQGCATGAVTTGAMEKIPAHIGWSWVKQGFACSESNRPRSPRCSWPTCS